MNVSTQLLCLSNKVATFSNLPNTINYIFLSFGINFLDFTRELKLKQKYRTKGISIVFNAKISYISKLIM